MKSLNLWSVPSGWVSQLDDEDSILPHKLQAALEHVLDKRKELANDKDDLPSGESTSQYY